MIDFRVPASLWQGPVYDPVHGVYHLHYQNHVGLHGGRTYGHAVSKDLTHWAHMPISIW